MKYFVTVGERTLEVVVDGEVVTVDGRHTVARIDGVAGTPEFRVVIDGLASMVAVAGHVGAEWQLVADGGVREVAVEDERTRHIRLLAGAGKAVAGHATLKAPMPGLVLRVLVAVGDPVAAGAPLLALEAMKMENELKAAAPGVVTAVLVAPGQAVEKGQKLLELGPQT
jgi:biotin carboxyl carrier protein